jgi:hypothetical protein
MILSEIKTLAEVAICVDMYLKLNDYSFLPADRNLAIQNLSMFVRRKKFVRTLVRDEKIVAWIYASPCSSSHMSEKIIQQNYYCSNLQGVSAFRAVKILHEALIEYAIKLKADLVVSPGSHLDEENRFVKILEKIGWNRRGYIAVYKISNNE